MRLSLLPATLLLLALTLAGPLPLRAQSTMDRMYVRVAAGPNWLEDADLKGLFGPAPGSTAQFDLGTRTLTTVGYKLNNWASVEAELGSSQNGIKQLGADSGGQAGLSSLGLLFNGKLRWANRTRFTPYIGAGLGPSALFLNADHFRLGALRTSGWAYDTAFEYQAMAGVRWAFGRKLGLSLEYRYSGSSGSDFLMPISLPGGRAYARLGLGWLAAHSVTLALDANF